MSVIRSAALRGFRDVVTQLGGDPEALAVEAGLPLAALDSDDVLIPELVSVRTLEFAARRLECFDLGLRMATRQDLSALGPLALAIRAAPTAADALECASRYLFLHSRSLTLSVQADPDGARGVVAIRYGVPAPAAAMSQAIDLGLGVVHRTIAQLLGERYGLRSVDLPYIPRAPLDVYEDFFGAPVRIARPTPLLRVPTSLAKENLSSGDESLMALALTMLAELDPNRNAPASAQVRVLLRRCLGTTPAEIGVIARMLAVHPRTLQRHLAAENTTFGDILDDVRRQEVYRYLTSTDMPMSQITRQVGLNNQSVLSRLTRRWWDATPRDVRNSDHIGTGDVTKRP
ncbi:AraC family transcriptional regulator [Nocardia gamkensis]|uniref:AraC family transcriptional regulator n=1 Tax=Nocardia TaxID=1817 RepID=UPI0034095C28